VKGPEPNMTFGHWSIYDIQTLVNLIPLKQGKGPVK